MRMVTDKSRITIYAICTIFFALAGFFQAYDARLSEFWHALFSLLAHTIIISIVVVWGVSLIHRMVRKDLRTYFLIVDSLILFFLVVRMIKYGLTKDTDTLSRYLWYSYYIPLCFIPPTVLLASLSIENKNGKALSKVWNLVYAPAIVLVSFVFTNDIHQLVFSLSFVGDSFTYKHQFLFYIILAWEIIVTFLSLIILIMKCSISACKKRTWIPISVFFICATISAICFLTNTSAFKIPELLCFTIIVVIESCIAIRIIPTNYEYENYFYNSAYSAIITDENFKIIYNYEKPFVTDEKIFESATKGPVMLDKNMQISAEKIHGGYVFRKEDMSSINEINDALFETNERLSEENYLIEAENELKKQRAQIIEQNRLYTKTEECTSEEIKRLEKLLSSVSENDNRFIDEMHFACVLATYIKRRSNIIMLSEKYSLLDINELSLAIKESFDYLSLLKIECSYDLRIFGKIDGKSVGVLYDFFEFCIVGCDDLPTAISIHLYKQSGDIVMLIESDTNVNNVSIMLKKLETKFSDYKTIVKTDEAAVYFSLLLPIGGEL